MHSSASVTARHAQRQTRKENIHPQGTETSIKLMQEKRKKQDSMKRGKSGSISDEKR